MTKVTIKYNTPVIVNKYVYSIIMSQLAGACALVKMILMK